MVVLSVLICSMNSKGWSFVAGLLGGCSFHLRCGVRPGARGGTDGGSRSRVRIHSRIRSDLSHDTSSVLGRKKTSKYCNESLRVALFNGQWASGQEIIQRRHTSVFRSVPDFHPLSWAFEQQRCPHSRAAESSDMLTCTLRIAMPYHQSGVRRVSACLSRFEISWCALQVGGWE